MGFHQFQSLPQNSGKKAQEGNYGFRINCHARTSMPIWICLLGVTQAKIGYSGSATLCFFSSLFFGVFWHKCDRVVDWCSNPTHACCQGGAGGWKKINLRLWAAFLFCYTEHWERPILQQIDDRMALLKHIFLINLDFCLLFLEYQPRLDLCP